MNEQDYQTTITVDVSKEEAFKSINSISKWWTEDVQGSWEKVNDEFAVRFGDVHFSRQKVVERIPNKRLVWLVTGSKLSFIKDQQEWTNTRIRFELASFGNKTEVRFTHFGLTPGFECYEACSNAWGTYIRQSLASLMNTGKGQPTRSESEISGA